jgi:hypothetical protein
MISHLVTMHVLASNGRIRGGFVCWRLRRICGQHRNRNPQVARLIEDQCQSYSITLFQGTLQADQYQVKTVRIERDRFARSNLYSCKACGRYSPKANRPAVIPDGWRLLSVSAA